MTLAPPIWPVVVLAFVTVQRLGELWLANRHTKALLAKGAREVGAAHYPFMVALHTAWLVGLWALAWNRPVSLAWLAAFLVLQALRVWILATLGERWTTRIIVLEDAPLVTRGPYRFLSHPNYAVVIGEIAILPLAFAMPVYAAVFTVLNAVMLGVRIREEERALRGR